MAKITDERTEKSAVGYVVFTDSFLSNWGPCEGGRSLYALAVSGGPLTSNECITVMRNGKQRTDMKRGRYVRRLPRLGKNDHLTIVDKTVAPRWYLEDGFILQQDNVPPCATSMGCLCAGHARGNDASEPCDTTE